MPDRSVPPPPAVRAPSAHATSGATAPDLPTLFVSHGAPNLLLGDLPVRRFLAGLTAALPRPPRAILCLSAHWLTREPAVDTSSTPRTIHDFSGFEPELYRLTYDAPGAPALAEEVADALAGAGLDVRREKRGLDHGAWVPLRLAWPGADVPVTQLSLQPDRDAAHHYRVGQALAGLRRAGVLVMGSGGATHNLRELGPGDRLPDWAAAFDDWLDRSATAGDAEALVAWETRAPQARRNHPTPDHYLPIVTALGAAGAGARGTTLHASAAYGSLSLRAFAFA